MSSLKRVHVGLAAGAVLFALLLGGIAGFFVGVASTNFGKSFIEDVVETEEPADTAHPTKLVRGAFRLEHPGNWSIDTRDEDYDPDHRFSIESPGSAFVMFSLGAGELNLEEGIEAVIEPFRKVMSSLSTERFEEYGSFHGAGAILRGRVLGSRTTVRVFAFGQDDLYCQITEHYPDEDLRYVAGGLRLIEDSFSVEGGGDSGR